MAEAPLDLPRAQRWFAIECNNAAWDLLEKPTRTADETERMLHAAHASMHHWLAVGNELNHLRGMVLLANVYAGAGLAEEAIRYAEQALALSDAVGDAQSAFDRATVQAAASRAYLLCGDAAHARAFFGLAQQAAEQLDADDRQVFDQLCPKL
jgi:tetratricopeptide (TPR) repeat protein